VNLNFVGNEYELYAQDSWKIRPNLTITGGIRYSLMPPVHEANGQQTSPNINMGTWLGNRGGLAAQGLSQAGAGEISFILSSMPGGLPLYPYNKDWAPRLGLAWSPSGTSGLAGKLFGGPGKTSIRAGFGMYYDLIGQPLASTFASTMFGLSSSLSNTLNILDATTSPRFTDFWSIPSSNAAWPVAPPAGFPAKYPTGLAITNSVDNLIKAPYTMNMNLSWGRDLGKGLFIQASYVGRLSRHSLIQRDVAMPTNLKDPASGMTYFQAMDKMATWTDLNPPAASRGNSWQTIAPIAFFENMWPGAAGNGYTATQWITNQYLTNTSKGDFTTALQAMDMTCNPTVPPPGSVTLLVPNWARTRCSPTSLARCPHGVPSRPAITMLHSSPFASGSATACRWISTTRTASPSTSLQATRILLHGAAGDSSPTPGLLATREPCRITTTCTRSTPTGPIFSRSAAA
jgi:hypothetical protein